jgi:hypothetical protein
MLRSIGLLLLALSFTTVPATGQVIEDDFSDGDFTQNPSWIGDADRFTVVPFDDGNALRSEGIAAADTIYLATASTVAYGYWHFVFRHEVSLSNVNGSRVYLVATSPDLKGVVQGYYVQFGTNNLNRVELWRQDGATENRVRLGVSESIVTGEANTVAVEVTRDEGGTWTVFVDGTPVIGPVTDATHTTSAAIGVWVRHNATGRDRFFWTDFVADADPGDITPPRPQSVAVLDHGATLLVAFDEPLDPETVGAEAFSVDQGIGAPVAVALEDDPARVRLTFEPPIPEGAYRLMVAGVADVAGNVQHETSIAFAVTIDEEPPSLVSAHAVSPTLVRVEFDEPVEGCDRELYEVSPDVGLPTSVQCPSLDVYELLLGQALTPGKVYTVTARSVSDLAGNIQPATSATFYFGEILPAGPGDVVINEIMYAPPPPTTNEWVELLNVANHAVDLAGFTIADQSREVVVATSSTILAPGGFAVLARNPSAFEEAFPGVAYIAVPGFPTLLNAADAVVLRYTGGHQPVTVDSVFYHQGWGGLGASLERRSPQGPSHSFTNWATTLDPRGGTPGEPNSVPPDTEPPRPEDVEVSPDGRTLVVRFDEPLNPASVTPGAFHIEGVEAPVAADYTGDFDPGVELSLADPLPGGTYTVTVSGIADLVGNVAEHVAIEFTYTPDVTPPAIAHVVALDASTVRIRFTEPVEAASASDPANYAISGGIGHPEDVVFAPAGRQDEVDLMVPTTLEEGVLYTVTVSRVADLAGNVLEEATARFLVGQTDVPAPGDVVINEIMYREAAGGTEYVELRNVSDKVFDLSRFTLSDRGAPRTIAGSPVILPPGGYLAIARDVGALRSHFGTEGDAFQMPNLPNLANTGDVVVLRFGGAPIDSVAYHPYWQRPEIRSDVGIALERLDPRAASTAPDNWTSSLDPRGGTPGQANSVALPTGEAPPTAGVTATPSPFSGSAGTIVRYTLAADAGVVRIRVFDGAGRLVRTLEDAVLAGNARTGEVPWNGRDDRGQSLRVGIYIVVLEALDLAGARTEVYRAPVVLAREF